MNLFRNSRGAARRAALYRLPLALLLLPLAAPALRAQQPSSRPDGRDIHALVETERATYHAGEKVRVRISLQNVSSAPISFFPYPPNSMVLLVITRQDGSEVQRRWAGGGGGTSGVTATRLEPRQTAVQLWNGAEWLPLNSWGYDIREPGRYTIVGIPRIGGSDVQPDWKTVRSNRATFTVVR